MIKIEKNIPVDVFFRDVFNLCELHWEEIANNKEAIKLAPNVEQYTTMQNAGILNNLVIYDDEKIVGYSVLLIAPHLHYMNDKYAYVDVLYLNPEYRKSKLGILLVNETEKFAKEQGAKIIQHHVKPHHQTLGKIIERKGYKVAETIYAKLLEN